MFAMAAFRAVREVPFVGLRRQHAAMRAELRAAFDRVLAESRFVLGEEVESFESEFAELTAACAIALAWHPAPQRSCWP